MPASNTELLPSEGLHDTTDCLRRVPDWLNRRDVAVERVMTDNGSAYRSKLFAQAQHAPEPATSGPGPTPRTNGKAERLIQTTLRE